MTPQPGIVPIELLYLGPACSPGVRSRQRLVARAPSPISSSPLQSRKNQVMKNPKARMWLWLIISFVLIGLALFLSAGTINYWQAWAYLGVGAVSSVPLTLHIIKDPILLENRTKAGPTAEQRPIQKIIVACSGVPAIAAFIVPGLDYRFGWSSAPSWLSLIGGLLIFVALWMVYRGFQEKLYC